METMEKIVTTVSEVGKAIGTAVASGVEAAVERVKAARRPAKKAKAKKVAARKAAPRRAAKKAGRRRPSEEGREEGRRASRRRRARRSAARRRRRKSGSACRRLAAHVERLIDLALEEDLLLGDVTSEATIPAAAPGRGHVPRQGRPGPRRDGRRRARLRAARGGVPLRPGGRRRASPGARSFGDGDRARPGAARRGADRAQLPAAPLRRRHRDAPRAVDALAAGGAKTRLLDTRKTTPGWRMLEKEAVRAGGGKNHRFSLGDGILIKDNHVAACGGVAEAVRRARAARRARCCSVEVEVVDLPGLDAAIAAGADIVLLDNMDDAAMAEAVRRAAGPGPARGERQHDARAAAARRRDRGRLRLDGRRHPQRAGGGHLLRAELAGGARPMIRRPAR